MHIVVTYSCVSALRPWCDPEMFRHRQHVCCIIHKSPGRRALQSLFQVGYNPPSMGGLSFTFHQSSAHSRSSKPRSGHAFEERNSSGGVETSSRLSSNDLALSAALLTVSCPTDRGCSDIVLTESQTSRVPSSEDFASGVAQNHGGESVCDLHCPKLAESALVSRSEGGPDLGEFPSGGTCCLKRMVRYGTPAQSCGAFMCGCFKGLGRAERSATQCA